MPIIFDRSGMIEQVYQNPETKVGKEICPSHVVKVWKAVNALIQRSLCTGKGVKIPRLFTITFKVVEVETQVDSGEGISFLQRQPRVYLAHGLVSKFSIQTKRHSDGHLELPETDLNVSHVALICRMTRENVELCLEEIFIAFERAIEDDGQVELWLNKIGRIIIDSGAVRIAFCPTFLNLLGYSEDVKRSFAPHPHPGRESSFMEDIPSSSISSCGEPDDVDYDISDKPPSPPKMNEEVEVEEEPETSGSPETAHSTPAPDRRSVQSRFSDPRGDAQSQGDWNEAALEKQEESEEDKIRRANAHRTLLERECVARETFLVWETISKYIIRKMMESLAVKIPGLGTFTHSILPNDLTQDKFEGSASLRKSRKFPIFQICPHLKEMNMLKEENALNQCNAPVINLNVRVIASESKLTPGIVDGIITETLQAFARGIITNKNVEFPFPFIGKLHVKEQKVFMLFYEEFCEGLEFNFRYDPSFISSVIPGQMTPLVYHRPSPSFQSVFHYEDMKRVDESMRAETPCVYGGGKLVRDRNEDRCTFLQKLHLHSNLLFDCTCCNCTKRKLKEKQRQRECEVGTGPDEDEEDPDSSFCDYSRNYDRIQQSCCTQPGAFSFRQPDGSTFSPEALYNTAKTGNPILDRLTDDKCLMQQAIGCWMKRGFMKTLGAEELAKHYDRDYFKNIALKEEEADIGGGRTPKRKSYLVRGILTPVPTPEDMSEIAPVEKVSPAPSPKTSIGEEAPRLPQPTISVQSVDSESVQQLPVEFIGKDSMIIGMEEQKRKSDGGWSGGARVSGVTDMRGSMDVQLGTERGDSFMEDHEFDHSRYSRYSHNYNSAESSRRNTREMSLKEEETGSAKDTSEGERKSIRLTTGDYLDDDYKTDYDKDTATATAEDTDSKSKSSPQDGASSKVTYKTDAFQSELGEQTPSPDDERPTVHLYESEWFNRPDMDQGSEEDLEMDIHLEEDEVLKNLGLKKKKKCKPESKLPGSEGSRASSQKEKDSEQQSMKDKEEIRSKKRSLASKRSVSNKSTPTNTKAPPSPSPKRHTKSPIIKTPPPPPPRPTLPHKSIASHNLGAKRLYVPKAIPKPKSIERKIRAAKPKIHQTTQTKRPKSPKRGERPRSYSEERKSTGRTASLVFRSASSILCCSPPASFAQILQDPILDDPMTSFGMGSRPYHYMRRASGTSVASLSQASSCPSRTSRKSGRCNSAFCPPPSPKYKRQQQDQDQGDFRADNDLRGYPTPAVTPRPSTTDMCYARFCPTQRKEADMCYMKGCPTVDICCPVNFSCDCVVAALTGNNPNENY